ncbi:MAG: diguanylate cyclase (GGDEF)-like protein [Kiritimatiellia bacterium]
MTAARKIAQLPRLNVGSDDDWNTGLAHALGQSTAASRVDALLDLGRRTTGLTVALLAHVRGEQWGIQAVLPASTGLPSELPLSETLCQHAIAAQGVVGAADLLNNSGIHAEHFPFGAWIGAPVGSHGTVAFASERVRDTPFTETEVAQVKVIAALLHRDVSLSHGLQAGASFDMLTGLPTLLGVQHKLNRLLARSSYLNKPIMTMLVALDDFGSLTLKHGDAIGEQVLRAFGSRLEDAVRPRDIVARLDRDGFLAVLPDADLEHMRAVADRVRIAMSTAPIQTDAGPLIVPCSVGVVATPPDDNQVNTLLGKGYAALRTSKLAGKGRVTVLL